jgi:hypothetical protein
MHLSEQAHQAFTKIMAEGLKRTQARLVSHFLQRPELSPLQS